MTVWVDGQSVNDYVWLVWLPYFLTDGKRETEREGEDNKLDEKQTRRTSRNEGGG